LTVLSISMSLFLISTLRTLLEQLESPPLTPESATRVLTRHQTSLANILPISYRDKIRQVPGVQDVSAYQWVGAIYKDPAKEHHPFVHARVADPGRAGRRPGLSSGAACKWAFNRNGQLRHVFGNGF
jgi:hypothetical protein